jgi:hypothetical protein
MKKPKPKLIKRKGRGRRQKKKKLSYEEQRYRKVYRLFEQDLIDAAGDAEPIDGFYVGEFDAKQPVVKAYHSVFHRLIHDLEKDFKPLLLPRRKWPTPKWLYSTKKLRNALKNNQFDIFYTYIRENTLKLGEIEQMVENKTIDMHYKNDQDEKGFYPIVFIPDYQHIRNTLWMAQRTARHYLVKFTEAGIVKSIGKIKHGKKVYAIGYYHKYRDSKTGEWKPNSILFLKNTPEIRQAIVDLKMGWKKDTKKRKK